MHDDIPLTIGRATRVLRERILPAVHATAVPLAIERSELPGEPIPVADGIALDYATDAIGAPWGPAWGTTWFRLTGTLPAAWAGRRVEAVVDLGFDVNMTGFQCEALVYRPDGTPVKSLNPRNQWIPVARDAQGDERVELYLEAAANPVLLDYHPFVPTQEGDVRTASTTPLYATRRADLAIFEADVHALALDVEVLVELQAELPETAPRRMRILQALDDALDELDLQDVPGSAAAARERLVDVLASPAEASAHELLAIGHAHIDSAWLWPVRETIRKVARTASSMTELIDETDDFRFGMSSAQQYAWLRDHRPEVFARVRDAVAAGRFVPLGGMWVESDTVMPSGESLVRQFQYGQRFFERELGVRCSGVWLPDSFGYSPALPQLMCRAGFEWFFTQKISWNQVNRFPHHTFAWEGIDGSRILSHFPPMDTYNSQLSGAEVARATRQFRESRVATQSIAPVGWGDGGGGTTREMVGKAQRLANLEGSATVRWQHPDAFFATAREQLPDPAVWVGELYLELHRGTLTSQHGTKRGNRRCEQLLVEAELWWATAAVRTGAAYPYEALERLWESVLLHQFHDILPGTSIAWVHREALKEYARIEREAAASIDAALDALLGDGETRLVVNPAAVEREGVAPASAAAGERVTTGVEVRRDGDDVVLDNGVVRVRIDARGLLVSAVDLASGIEAIAAGRAANALQLHQDFPNMWDAWDIDRFYRNRVTDLVDVDAIAVDVDDDGAHVTVDRSFSRSSVRQVLTLAPASHRLEVTQTTQWHEVEKLLKVAFPTTVRAARTAAETQFGAVERVTHTNTSWEAARFETAMHRYVHVAEPGFGVALATDSTYGYDVTRDAGDDGIGTTVRLSLLRAPRFPDPETDQGEHVHRYAFAVGADRAAAVAAGIALNTPLRRRTGTPFAPLVAVHGDDDAVLLSSVTLAADRSGDVVVRVYESLGRRATATIVVDGADGATEVSLLEEPIGERAAGASHAIALGAYEVRTMRFAMQGGAR